MVTEATRNRLDVLMVVAATTTTLLVGIGAYEYQQLRADLTQLEEQCTESRFDLIAVTKHTSEHNIESNYWKNVTLLCGAPSR